MLVPKDFTKFWYLALSNFDCMSEKDESIFEVFSLENGSVDGVIIVTSEINVET